MTILSASAGIVFTTKALTFDQAHRFARCCNANGQYTEVTVKPNGKGKFTVSYQPTSAARIAKLTAAFQGTREERAAAQAHCYDLRSVVNGGFQVVEVINLISGAVYSVHPNGRCDCPDAQHRCAGNGVLCKHALMVRNEQQEREAQHLSNLPPAALCAAKVAPSAAEIARRMAIDFPDF